MKATDSVSLIILTKSEEYGSVSQRVRYSLQCDCGENVPAPVVIISKADAKHVPTTVSIRRVVDQIGGPRQPDVRAFGISDQDEAWLMLRLP